MGTSTKGRSVERPPSPSAPSRGRHPHRVRISIGAAVLAGLALTAIGPAAADEIVGTPSTAPKSAAVTRVVDAAPAPTGPTADELFAERDRRILAAALEEKRIADEQLFRWLYAATQAEQEAAAQAAAEAAAAEAAAAEQARQDAAQPPAPSAPSGGVWDSLAQCESGGNWGINTGNGYYGGLQFSLGTWQAYGGSGMPHQQSREAQIAIAQRVQAGQGWGAWPSCSSKLGLR